LNLSKAIIGLPGYQVSEVEWGGGEVRVRARHAGPVACPGCGSERLRTKDRYVRVVRHENWGFRRCLLELEGRKFHCRDCGRYFRQRFPGILPWQRTTEVFQRWIFQLHWDGVNRSRLGRRQGLGAATVERYFRRQLERRFGQWHSGRCPPVLGLDEQFFSRRHGYATTLCDLRRHKVFDVVLGRSQAALESYFRRLEGKDRVRVVCMDLASPYRALVRRHFPRARIVADRFHVIRLINQHFLACWREVDPVASRSRGLVSLIRRHSHNLTEKQRAKLEAYFDQQPVVRVLYRFKQRLCYLLLKKHRTRRQCEKLIPRFLRAVQQLREAGLAQLVSLGQTLWSWREEIVAMWRFTRTNGITEGFHNKMELLKRQAYGFRNFNNYRMRVKILCAGMD